MIRRIILIISILLTIAFATLLERKLLRLSQSRKGPEIVGSIGLLQPFSDGLKLLTKREILWSGRGFMLVVPRVMLLCIIIFWMPITSRIVYINLGCLYLLAVGSLSGLCVLAVGWYGGRSYSFIGGLRAAAQIISYEVVLSFFFLLFCSIEWSLNLFSLKFYWRGLIISLGLIFFLWIVIIVAETNRAPFDISEGESELVSGFNTEYSSILFTMLFIGEYGMIAGYRLLTSYFFIGSWIAGPLVIVIILWIRRCFPRKRYDTLMMLLWVYYFPLVIFVLISWVFGLFR